MRAIPFDVLGYYLRSIDSYFVSHEEEPPPEDLEIFRAKAEKAGRKATENGELDELRAALDFALAHDHAYFVEHHDTSLAELVQSENLQLDSVLRPILMFYRTVIWPDAGPVPIGGPSDVEMVTEPIGEWRKRRQSP